jgi:hypothetical protein
MLVFGKRSTCLPNHCAVFQKFPKPVWLGFVKNKRATFSSGPFIYDMSKNNIAMSRTTCSTDISTLNVNLTMICSLVKLASSPTVMSWHLFRALPGAISPHSRDKGSNRLVISSLDLHHHAIFYRGSVPRSGSRLHVKSSHL